MKNKVDSWKVGNGKKKGLVQNRPGHQGVKKGVNFFLWEGGPESKTNTMQYNNVLQSIINIKQPHSLIVMVGGVGGVWIRKKKAKSPFHSLKMLYIVKIKCTK